MDRKTEIVEILNRYGPLTERALATKMEKPAKNLMVILKYLKREGKVEKQRSTWVSVSGPKEPTETSIVERKNRLSQIATARMDVEL